MSNLSSEEWKRLRELKAKSSKLNSDEMSELTILNCKLYGMVGKLHQPHPKGNGD